MEVVTGEKTEMIRRRERSGSTGMLELWKKET